MVITITCPSCSSSFPVDPAKIPEGGVNARCSSCGDVFRVEKPAEPEPLPTLEEVAPPEPEVVAEAPPEPEVVAEAPPEPEPMPEVVEPMPAFDEPVAAEPDPAPPPMPEVAAEPEPEVAEPLPSFDDPAVPEPMAEAPAADAFTQPVEPDPVPPPMPEVAAEPEPEPEVAEPLPTFEEPTVPEPMAEAPAADPFAQPAPFEAAPPAAVEPEPEPAKPAVQGFTFGKRDPTDKAKRLARVLVSDMIMYNAERHQSALAAGTLVQDFEEEIDKSWKEFVDQVGEDLANAEGRQFWTQALNDILAKGQEVF